MRIRPLTLSVAVAAALTACITVNIYFPAPEVREAAEQIVEETWGSGGATSDAAEPEGSSWLGLFGPATAHAQDADINVSTAAIRALKESMKARSEELKPFLNGGSVGIAKDGMLAVRSLDDVSLRDKATVRRLVDAENRDRESLYKEIAKANNFGDDRVGDIQRIFAETWIAKAEPGWWKQKPDGSWTR